MTSADTLKQQIRRRIFVQDFRQGEAATSRFAAFFATCPVCRGRGIVQQCVHYEDQVICERSTCDQCDGAGFVAVAAEEQAAKS